MNYRLKLMALSIFALSCGKAQNLNDTKQMEKVNLTEQEWKDKLSPDTYKVLREKGTERPFTGEFYKHFEPGIYVCGGCGQELFSSDTKFDAHCGWPSFWEVLDKSKVKEIIDKSHGMIRTEVVCAKCDGHLGHVFNDGPSNKTGLRYCINSVSIDFKSK